MSKTASPTSLEQMVRQRRESLDLSVDALADRARVSPSAVRRVEAGHRTLPAAVKLAQIFTVLGIGAAEVRSALTDEQYLGDVLHRLERSAEFVEVAETVRSRRATVAQMGDADFLARKDDRVAAINGGGLTLRDDLKQAGWSIWVVE